MSFDPACYNLAEHFLPTAAPDRLKSGLAQAIQDAVEIWIEAERDRLLRELGPGFDTGKVLDS